MPLVKKEKKEFDQLKIGLASTKQVLSWSYGEVEKPETINYRTFKPERRGLFCEKIFGPVKDWECHCGKYRRVRYRGIVCERCGVEVTTSRVRRERMGHIKLVEPVAHIWFLKGVPGYISLLLNVTTRALEEVIYYDAFIVTQVSEGVKKMKVGQILREADYQDALERWGSKFKASTGARPVKELLEKIDLSAMVSKLRKDLKTSTGQKRLKIVKRLRVAEAFQKSNNRPEWMIMEVMPVIPPDLRPMVQLEGGRFATSDLNDLYRRVLNRNNRLKKMINMGAPDMIIRNEKRMLQESVDVLIDNGRRKRAVTGSSGRPLKSLTDIIEGKQGRFRQNLLGKRVDYSGRSVIVVGPSLKLHQCGLPKDMTLELFKPFVIRKLVDRGIAQNVKSAKRMIEKRDIIVWDILEEVIKGHPVLLNRAPTLHRLGVQAFEPVLVEGKAIQIHPLVCSAFNADFDGDQMAVHVPLLPEAQVEARILMLASTNLLSPASGRPVVTPTQDMVLGTYYMTVENENVKLPHEVIFANDSEAMVANDVDHVHLQAKVKVRRAGEIIETTVGRIKFNYTLSRVLKRHGIAEEYPYINRVVNKKGLEKVLVDCFKLYGSAVTAGIADEIKRLGFKYATLAGVSIAIEDLVVPEEKKKIVTKAAEQVSNLEKHFRNGDISKKEKFLRSLDIWSQVTESVTQKMLDQLDKLNSVYMMAFSGARGNVQQVRQLSGIRGLMADPSGNIIEIPIKANFKEGLNVTEYFISSYGARKGLVDTALRTADSGYLTRRLVDVSQDVMITELDCGSKEGIELTTVREGYDELLPLWQRLVFRTPVKNVIDPISNKIIAKAGEIITEEETAKAIYDAGIERLQVRSAITCKTKRGICQKCYGLDLSVLQPVNIGEAVGIIAAQSIGEPGTQLTMRTFHIGGVALHKGALNQVKTKHGGIISFDEGIEIKQVLDEEGKKQKISTRNSIIHVKIKNKKEEYPLPVGAILKVKQGQKVAVGEVIAEYDPTYEYVVASAPGKTMFLDLQTTTKRGAIQSKKDGEIFVYNPRVVKDYDVPKGAEVFVKFGDKINAGDEVASGIASKTSGLVIEVKAKSIGVAPGENYAIAAGSWLYVKDGENIESYDVLAKVESIRRDPSKTRDIIQGLPKVEELFEARKSKNPAVLSDIEGVAEIKESEGMRLVTVKGTKEKKEYLVPYETRLRVATNDKVHEGMQLTEGIINPHEVLRILGVKAVQTFLVDEIQKIYRSQGVTISDKHVEIIVRQMTKKVRVVLPGTTTLLPGELIETKTLAAINEKTKGEKATATEVLLGITRASLSTESFISAASFQETARVLTEASVKGKTDEMYGLKENIIIGKLIPAGSGFEDYRYIELVPTAGIMSQLKIATQAQEGK